MTPSRILDPALRGAEQRVISDDDAWLDHLRGECAKALAEYMQAKLNIKRPIESLTRDEMLGIVEAVTAQWIVSVSRRLGDVRTPKQQEYTTLLMGG